MKKEDILSWIGTFVSILASVIRALNVGYYMQTYIMSSISNVILIYNAYKLKSNQLMVLNSFHLLICLIGIYNWT